MKLRRQQLQAVIEFATIATLLSLVLSGCSGAVTSSAKAKSSPPGVSVAPTPIACGDPTPLVKGETLGIPAASGTTLWAVAGPLRFAVYAPFKPGSPTKVPITVEKPLETNVTLKGWRCSDGHPLRFWYEKGSQPDPVWNPKTLETVGDRVATLVAYGANSGINAYGGYILFTTPEKWKVSVFQGDRLLASVVFLVGDQSNSSLQPQAADFPTLRKRPLAGPTSTDSDCPGSPISVRRVPPGESANPIERRVRGPGPVYIGVDHESGYFGKHFIWIEPGVADPVLIRGKQIGNSQRLLFGEGPFPNDTAPVLTVSRADLRTDFYPELAMHPHERAWGAWIGFWAMPATGCYFLQADGPDLSEVIVFPVTAGRSEGKLTLGTP
jgi:hypothetical protein